MPLLAEMRSDQPAIPAAARQAGAQNALTLVPAWVRSDKELPMIQRLSSSLDFQAEALMLRGQRQRVIASNIANADTPGYVARDF